MFSSFHKRRVRVFDSYISYIDTRAGEHTFILLHGNVASNYIWRGVIPRIHGYGRCLAPDLLGMGNSGVNPTNEYGYEEQFRYINEWMKAVISDKERVIFVGFEWGAALAFRWAHLNPTKVLGVVFIEGIFAPIRNLEDINSKLIQNLYITVQKHLAKSRQIKEGSEDPLAKEFKMAVSQLLAIWAPDNGLNNLYGQHAIIDLFRDLPIKSRAPHDVTKTMQEVNGFMGKMDIPKLLIEADEGVYSAIASDQTRYWRNLRTATVTSRAIPPESCPTEIAELIVSFLKSVKQK